MDYDWLHDVPGGLPKGPRKTPKMKAAKTTARTKERRASKRKLEMAYQKNKRIAFHRDGKVCRCGCGEIDVTTHHLVKRGMAGGSRDDSVENLVTLGRRKCHPDADDGRLRITPFNTRKRCSGRLHFRRDGRTWVTAPLDESIWKKGS